MNAFTVVFAPPITTINSSSVLNSHPPTGDPGSEFRIRFPGLPSVNTGYPGNRNSAVSVPRG
eukprot:3935142-Rhodomonas_salina.1